MKRDFPIDDCYEAAFEEWINQRTFSAVDAAAVAVLHGAQSEFAAPGQSSRYIRGDMFKLRTFISQRAPARMRCKSGRDAIFDTLLGVGAFKRCHIYGHYAIHPRILTDARISRISDRDAHGRMRLTAYGVAREVLRGSRLGLTA